MILLHLLRATTCGAPLLLVLVRLHDHTVILPMVSFHGRCGCCTVLLLLLGAAQMVMSRHRSTVVRRVQDVDLACSAWGWLGGAVDVRDAQRRHVIILSSLPTILRLQVTASLQSRRLVIILDVLKHALVVDSVIILSQRRLLIRYLHLFFKHVLAGVLVAVVGLAAGGFVLLAFEVIAMNVSIILPLIIATSIGSISARAALPLAAMLGSVVGLLLLLLAPLIMIRGCRCLLAVAEKSG